LKDNASFYLLQWWKTRLYSIGHNHHNGRLIAGKEKSEVL